MGFVPSTGCASRLTGVIVAAEPAATLVSKPRVAVAEPPTRGFDASGSPALALQCKETDDEDIASTGAAAPGRGAA
jgi:hypothetical protein